MEGKSAGEKEKGNKHQNAQTILFLPQERKETRKTKKHGTSGN